MVAGTPWTIAGAVLALAAGSFSAHAVDARCPPADAASAPTEPLEPSHALRAVRDKHTGKLRAPTADELKAMIEAERAVRKASGAGPATDPSAPIAVRRYPDGTLGAALGPDQLNTVETPRGSHGKAVGSQRSRKRASTHAAPVPDRVIRPNPPIATCPLRCGVPPPSPRAASS